MLELARGNTYHLRWEGQMSFVDCCDWDKCTECGECLIKCPVMGLGDEEAKAEFRLLLKGEVGPRVASECTLCFRCNSYCPEGLRPYELILQRITDRHERRPALLTYFLNGMPAPTLFSDIYGSLSFEEQQILNRWADKPEPSEDTLFIGCIGKMLCHDIENSTVLSELPKYGPSDVCCGELAYRGGDWQAYSDIVERALGKLSELDTKRLICYCGSCYNFLGNIMPKVYGKELPFGVISLYQWLLEQVDKGKIEAKRPVNCKYAVHESCYVSEMGPGFWEDLRRVYEAAGVELVELEHNRGSALSCGAASIAKKWNLFDIFKNQNKKYREVRNSGVKDVALNCPGCYLTMAGTSLLYGVKLHYMPDELLRAFGDDISTPLSRRFPRVAWALTKRAPLLLKKAREPLPRISP